LMLSMTILAILYIVAFHVDLTDKLNKTKIKIYAAIK
jgi:hypothetical protein